MNCNICDASLSPESIFCNKCGTRFEKKIEVKMRKVPHLMTVEDAVVEFFRNTITKGFLYDCCKKNILPHKKVSSGKILLDLDTLIDWWDEGLYKSNEPIKGLRRIN